MQKLYIGTNTKMYKTIAQTTAYINELNELTKDLDRNLTELFVIPSYTALQAAGKITADSHILLGAQNMCWEKEGQFTGEISPLMLKEIGVDIIMIGHSERRTLFGETDAMINNKMKAAICHQLTPLLCIGESQQGENLGAADETLAKQLKAALYEISPQEVQGLMIAYEPVWAIGTEGIPAPPAYIQSRHKTIRTVAAELFGQAVGSRIPILYGGNVNINNAAEIMSIDEINGLFIGRSAWDAQCFNNIIRIITHV